MRPTGRGPGHWTSGRQQGRGGQALTFFEWLRIGLVAVLFVVMVIVLGIAFIVVVPLVLVLLLFFII
jgi:hypothetical protein